MLKLTAKQILSLFCSPWPLQRNSHDRHVNPDQVKSSKVVLFHRLDVFVCLFVSEKDSPVCRNFRHGCFDRSSCKIAAASRKKETWKSYQKPFSLNGKHRPAGSQGAEITKCLQSQYLQTVAFRLAQCVESFMAVWVGMWIVSHHHSVKRMKTFQNYNTAQYRHLLLQYMSIWCCSASLFLLQRQFSSTESIEGKRSYRTVEWMSAG